MHSIRPSPPAIFLLFSILILPGCAPTVIYAPATGPVRLAENVAAHVYVRNAAGQWVKSANPVTLQAGEYVLQLPAATQP